MSGSLESLRSRRALIRTALTSGVAAVAAAAVATPRTAVAAAGDALRIGRNNTAGTSQTILNSNASGASFTLRTTNGATNSTGIFGWASHAGSFSTRGVYGRSDATTGNGVQGIASAELGQTAGVLGYALSTDLGSGVVGLAEGEGVGVYGSAGGALGWGVYSDGDLGTSGDLYVDGTIFKGGGGFRIDHPDDPAGKYLNHSFVESPDMKTFYDGIAVLDGSGSARVSMPAWFAKINRDVRYSLTAVGASMPNLHVSAEFDGAAFAIAGGAPRGRVSWTVTGIRKDPWAEANRIIVEQPKPQNERGTLLHPAARGQSADRATHRRKSGLRERLNAGTES